MQFLPEGSTPQWEGGAATAQYVQLARVMSCLHIFPLGTLFFCMHVHRLVHMFDAFCVHAFSFAITF